MERVITPKTFSELPFEIQQEIALNLDLTSLTNLCQASRSTNIAICEDNGFWYNKFVKDYGSPNWKRIYLREPEGLQFEYEEAVSELYVKFGERIIASIPDIEFEKDDISRLNILKNIRENGKLILGPYAVLQRNTDLPESGEFMIKIEYEEAPNPEFWYLNGEELNRMLDALHDEYRFLD